MDLQEATITMALLMKKEADFFKQHNHPEKGMNREDLKEYEWVRANTREFGNRLAANPNFFDVMESWIVNVSGTEGVAEDSMKSALKSADVEDLLDKASTLALSIKRHLRSNGHSIVDMGAGADGWDLSVRCSENKSREICRGIIQRYIKAIDMGLLSISRRFAGHSLPGLYSWDDAKRILLMYGDTLPTTDLPKN